MVAAMNETGLTPPPTPLSQPAPTNDTTRKPRKKETKNLTKRGGIWYFHRVVKGERTRDSLNTRDLIVAKAKRDAIQKAASGAEVDRVLGRTSTKPATAGEIFAAYRKAPTVRANADTRERNVADCERLVRAVRGDGFNVELAGAEIFTKQLVKDWQAGQLVRFAAAHGGEIGEAELAAEPPSVRRMLAALKGDLAALEASKRSLNSLLTHVQSLFSKEALDDYGALYLPPNVKEFAAAMPIAARKQEEPRQLADGDVAALLEKVKRLQGEDPGAWATFQLMCWGGLRNKECLHARESWLEQLAAAAAYRLSMKPAKDFMPKGKSRAVIIPAAIAEALLAQLPARAAGDTTTDRYLVPSKTYTDRKDATYYRLNTWLKLHGVTADAGKIAYRLRKYFLKKVEEQQGVFFAQAAGGHASLRTTQEHYIGTKKMAEPIKLGAG